MVLFIINKIAAVGCQDKIKRVSRVTAKAKLRSYPVCITMIGFFFKIYIQLYSEDYQLLVESIFFIFYLFLFLFIFFFFNTSYDDVSSDTAKVYEEFD